MSTVLIVVALVVVFAAVVAAVLYVGPGKAGGRRGRGLKRRFGPEYERTVALHDGDTKAAERELAERVTRHGDLRPRPLSREAREQYVALWAGLQEQFVDAPRQAVAEADRLLARLAEDRGFPAASAYEEQVAALSVHHAHHVDGYRRVHRTARADAGTGTGTGAGTEELRAAMIDARRLFEALVTAQPEDHARHAPRRPAARGHRVHAPWPKGEWRLMPPQKPTGPDIPAGARPPHGADTPGTAPPAGDLPGTGTRVPPEPTAPAGPDTPHRSGTSYRVGTLNEAAARDGAAAPPPTGPTGPTGSAAPVGSAAPAGSALPTDPAAPTGAGASDRTAASGAPTGAAASAGATADEGTSTSHTAHAPAGAGSGSGSGATRRTGDVAGVSAPLVPDEARDELGSRMQQALTGFVESPHRSVEEAAAVLDAAADRLTEALTEHRRALRADWDGDGEHEPDTEQLRVTLQAYRAMAERLLRV